MAFDSNSNLKYHIFKDYNINIDTSNSSFVSVRKVQWVKEGSQPDINKAKIEIRKISIKPEGEIPLKGVSIGDEKVVGDLTVGLVEGGFGDTKEIIRSISKRDNFKESIENIDSDEDSSDGELFDMRSLLLGLVDSNKLEEEE